jgi:pimeloyl-ACP methyl ester carboxylesterase
MREERLEIGGIPTRLYEPDGSSGLLLLGHGGTQSKDAPRFVDLCRQYAAGTGLAVVCIDAVDHGDRRPAEASPGLPARWHSSAAPQMTEDWVAVANGLAGIGPAIAYVGFSMGAIFGLCAAAALPDVGSLVLVVGGIPVGWNDDPPLRLLLLNAAQGLRTQRVLMINKSDDKLFPVPEVHNLFDALGTPRRQLMFWPGNHDDWPPDAIRLSIDFLNQPD